MIGLHVGADGPAAQTAAWGGDCAQVFLSAPMNYAAPAAVERRADCPAWVHAPYVLQVASEDPPTRGRSRQCLNDELEAALGYGAEGLVVHPGGHGFAGLQHWRRAAAGLTMESVPVLLENSAGANNAQQPEDLHELWVACQTESASFAVCVDTAHCWGAGWEPAEYVQRLQRLGTPIALVHANGSRREWASAMDGHADLDAGDDFLGSDAVAWAVALAGCPAICETPTGASVSTLIKAIERREIAS